MKDIRTTLDIKAVEAETFPEKSYADWLLEAEKTLGGKTIQQFHRETYEGITIKPLYTMQDVPDEAALIHGSLKGDQSWRIAQKITGKTVAEINQRLMEALRFGQNVLSFDLLPEITADQLPVLFENIPIERVPFFLDGKERTIPFYVMLSRWLGHEPEKRQRIDGFIGTDPYWILLENERSSGEWKEQDSRWMEGILFAGKHFPNVKTLFVDARVIERMGGHAIHQLAYALSEIVEQVESLKERGLEPKEIFTKIVAGFSVGSDFFMEIAKLRAFRYLWKKIKDAYGIKEPVEATVYAETTMVNKTKIDPYMNLIRTGSEAFSAVIGQVDYLRIGAFDEVFGVPSEKGSRLSLNTHHILKEEVGVDRVIDPAHGSYFVEHLTKSLIERAWERFLELDEGGGFLAALRKGTVQRELAQWKEKRQRDFHLRKKILVGTNRYADPREKPPVDFPDYAEDRRVALPPLNDIRNRVNEGVSLQQCVNSFNGSGKKRDHASFRLSERMEKLRREITNLVKEKGRNPVAALILEGDHLTHKGTIDFTSDFFASVGLDLVLCTGCRSTEKEKRFLDKTVPFITGYIVGKWEEGQKKEDSPLEEPIFYVSDKEPDTGLQRKEQRKRSLLLYPGIDQVDIFTKMVRMMGGEGNETGV